MLSLPTTYKYRSFFMYNISMNRQFVVCFIINDIWYNSIQIYFLNHINIIVTWQRNVQPKRQRRHFGSLLAGNRFSSHSCTSVSATRCFCTPPAICTETLGVRSTRFSPSSVSCSAIEYRSDLQHTHRWDVKGEHDIMKLKFYAVRFLGVNKISAEVHAVGKLWTGGRPGAVSWVCDMKCD